MGQRRDLPYAACVAVETDQLHKIGPVFVAQLLDVDTEVFVVLEVVNRIDDAGALLVRHLIC